MPLANQRGRAPAGTTAIGNGDNRVFLAETAMQFIDDLSKLHQMGKKKDKGQATFQKPGEDLHSLWTAL